MERTITIKGVGRYNAEPDTVEINVSLSGKSPEYEKAVEGEAQKYAYLADAIEKCGINRKDIKTGSYNVRISGRYVKNSFVNEGWECSRSLTIRFPLDSKMLNTVISAISNSLSEPNIRIEFTLSDTEDAKYILLQNAAADAVTKAKMLAEATGVRLGELISIDYNWSDINFYSDMEYSGCCGSIEHEFTPEDISMKENVTFVWSIS